jgi:hypothetical protein
MTLFFRQIFKSKSKSKSKKEGLQEALEAGLITEEEKLRLEADRADTNLKKYLGKKKKTNKFALRVRGRA